jgi:ATPase subunit of ABC transporter with duplicated ATPase domains
MIDVNNLEMRFPDKKLFENVSLKFNVGNTYGIIGPNGAGKSTFLKLLSSQLEPSKGNIHIEKNKRISILEQNHSIYDDFDVTTVVIMGNKELYEIKKEKDAIYMNPNSSSQDFEKAAELEEQYGLKGG